MTYVYYNEYEEKEVEHSINEDPVIVDSQGRPMKRAITNGNFILRGNGYYSTDHKKR